MKYEIVKCVYNKLKVNHLDIKQRGDLKNNIKDLSFNKWVKYN